MKTVVFFPSGAQRLLGTFLLLFCVAFLGNHPVRAGETTPLPDGKSTASPSSSPSPEEETTDYKNWIELGIGGVAISGNSAQFKQDHSISGDVFGGISDMHY